MASEPEMSDATSFLEQLISTRNRDISLFLPLILGFTGSPRRESDHNPDQEETGGEERPHERIILINPFTQGMIVIEGSRNLESLILEASNKEGLPPASKSSIDAMPKVEITEEDIEGGECAICLEGWEIGGEASEMPCKHRYHSNCIEKWLGIHGSCPVCRFKMPVDEEGFKKNRGGDEERRGRRSDREIWVTFSFNNNNSNNNNRTDSSSQTTVDSDSDSSSSSRPVDDAVVADGSSSNQEI